MLYLSILAEQTITRTSIVTKTISNNLWISLKLGNKISDFLGRKTATTLKSGKKISHFLGKKHNHWEIPWKGQPECENQILFKALVILYYWKA